MQRKQTNTFKPKYSTVSAVLAMLLWVLSGCVAVEKAVEPSPAAPSDTAVERLVDGREGFMITEVAHMDEASRQAFENAVAMLQDQDYDSAIEVLEQVITQSPGVSAPYIDLGMAYRRIDKPEQAEGHFKTALQLVPGHPVASNEYGLLCRKSGRFDEARKLYEQALAAFPEYYPLHRNLGILCDLYLNDLEGALVHYQIYSQAKPDDAQVKMWMADLHARLGVN